jgi:hypothetical protein
VLIAVTQPSVYAWCVETLLEHLCIAAMPHLHPQGAAVSVQPCACASMLISGRMLLLQLQLWRCHSLAQWWSGR